MLKGVDIGVIDNGDDTKLLSNVLVGVNAFSSNGELVVVVVVDIVDAVSGVIGRNEKLFEEDLAGFMVVEWRMVPPGRRVTLKGNGGTTFLVLLEENAVFEVKGDVATEAGEIVKNVSPTEIVVLKFCGGTGRGCLEYDTPCLLKSE